MEKIEKTLKYTKLFNLYGELLSKSQKRVFEDYFLADLSISEISENLGISRAAVEDSIKKSTKKLDYLESILHGLSKEEKIREKCLILQKSAANRKQIDTINKILEELDNGIWKSVWKAIKNL